MEQEGTSYGENLREVFRKLDVPEELDGVPAGLDTGLPEPLIPRGELEITGVIDSNTSRIVFFRDDKGIKLAYKTDYGAIFLEPGGGIMAETAELRKVWQQPLARKSHLGFLGARMNGDESVTFTHAKNIGTGGFDNHGNLMMDLGNSNTLYDILTPKSWKDQKKIYQSDLVLQTRQFDHFRLLDGLGDAILLLREPIPQGVSTWLQATHLASPQNYKDSISEGNLGVIRDNGENPVGIPNYEDWAEEFWELWTKKVDSNSSVFVGREEDVMYGSGDGSLTNAYRFGKGTLLADPPAALTLRNGRIAPWPFADILREVGATSMELEAFALLAKENQQGDSKTLDKGYESLLKNHLSYFVEVARDGESFSEAEEVRLKLEIAYWGQVRGVIFLGDAETAGKGTVLAEKKTMETEAMFKVALNTLGEL